MQTNDESAYSKVNASCDAMCFLNEWETALSGISAVLHKYKNFLCVVTNDSLILQQSFENAIDGLESFSEHLENGVERLCSNELSHHYLADDKVTRQAFLARFFRASMDLRLAGTFYGEHIREVAKHLNAYQAGNHPTDKAFQSVVAECFSSFTDVINLVFNANDLISKELNKATNDDVDAN